MLDTNIFIQKLIDNDYSHLCVVPCSFAKDIINASINNSDHLEYVPCASEAVACSIAAGLSMSGKKPIVIVQSSGLTNMGSCITSLLRPYGIFFPIIVSWRTYKDGDSEVQHQHLAKKLPDLVNAYGYEHQILDSDSIKAAVKQIDSCNYDNKILLLQKNTFSKVQLEKKYQLDLAQYPARSEYLKILNEEFKSSSTIFIGTTGNTAREMFSLMPDTKNFYMAGNMGGALSVGFGASMAGNNVIVCGGDAEFVMHMGALTTVGRYKTSIIYLLFDNESNKSTGGQDTHQSHLNYLDIAKNCGFYIIDDVGISSFGQSLSLAIKSKVPTILHLKVSYDIEMPRPPAGIILESCRTFTG